MFRELIRKNSGEINVEHECLHYIGFDEIVIRVYINNVKYSYIVNEDLSELNVTQEILEEYIEHTIIDLYIEQACMQYCIENGVKLEWLKNLFNSNYDESEPTEIINDRGEYKFICHYDKHVQHIKELFISDTIITIRPTNITGDRKSDWILACDDKFDKLIAAIFAHDIKIIAT
jgi:hypothetical protein